MSLTHHAAPDPLEEGCWMVGYMTPGTDVFAVVGQGYTERAARAEADRLNRAGAQADALAAAAQVPAIERKIPRGFYADGE
jgi:hypothetical protein